MSTAYPLVSVGIPVYNGQNYLAEAIESILAQSFEDLELIISDNASTDATSEICREYTARDERIRYVRNDKNLGAAHNYNQLVHMADGRYFKWHAHDDVCAPTFIEKCVAVLEADPDVVLCFTQTDGIDESGNVFRSYDNTMEADGDQPWKRFYATACQRHNMTASMTFGLMRAEVLRKTHMIGAFSSADRVLVGELALHGRIQMIPEVLFFKRDHPQVHWMLYKTRQQRIAWYDPTQKDTRTFPHWRLMQEHLVSLGNAPLSTGERLKSYAAMTFWLRYNWRHLLKNLIGSEVHHNPPRQNTNFVSEESVSNLLGVESQEE